MEILNKPICTYCNIEQALGVFRSRWICGRCLLKFEAKIRQENNKFLDIIEEQIKNDNRQTE